MGKQRRFHGLLGSALQLGRVWYSTLAVWGAQERWKPCQVYSFLNLDKSNFGLENKASSFNSLAIFTDRFGVWPTKYRLVNVHAFGGIFPLRINLICNEFRKGNEKMACTWLFQVGKCNLGVLWYLYSLQNLPKNLKQNNVSISKLYIRCT